MANLSKLTSRDAFLEAMTEFDQLGREAFLQRHGYQHANSVFVKHEGKLYDQRAIIGVAYGKQYPDEGPLDPKTFCGGLRTGRKLLVPLGFEVRQSGNSLGTITGAPILQVRVAGTQPGQSVKPATKRHATGGGRLANSSANAENCRRNGQIFEALAKLALQKAGFAEVRNLNEIRQNFPGFDILASKEGKTFAISVKGRNRFTNDGHPKTRYKLNELKIAKGLAELTRMNMEPVPAFIAVENDGPTCNIYFGCLTDTTRKNGIGMTDREKARYQCLAKKMLHDRSIQMNKYERE